MMLFLHSALYALFLASGLCAADIKLTISEHTPLLSSKKRAVNYRSHEYDAFLKNKEQVVEGLPDLPSALHAIVIEYAFMPREIEKELQRHRDKLAQISLSKKRHRYLIAGQAALALINFAARFNQEPHWHSGLRHPDNDVLVWPFLASSIFVLGRRIYQRYKTSDQQGPIAQRLMSLRPWQYALRFYGSATMSSLFASGALDNAGNYNAADFMNFMGWSLAAGYDIRSILLDIRELEKEENNIQKRD